ncbi:MAG TPA: MBL fold metallo-hydrolase [Candidatus Nanoarchaeia archaeon]|nr:MBL fold metallo-hydrolase [Candidatus Nanoarchaeia archaeon]
MIFEQIPVGEMQNFCYLIGCEKTKIAAVVDPAFEEGKLYEAAQKHGLTINVILLTHTHFDHIEAVGRVSAETKAAIYVHKNEASAVSGDVHTVTGGDTIKVGTVPVKVIETPGHTPGGVTYQSGKKLITGDALFVEGCGRTDLQGADPEVMWDTIKKFKAMPDEYEIYPGHDYGSIPHSTIKHEKEHNHFLLCQTREEFFSERVG